MTLSSKKTFKAAAVQASPVYYDLEASLQKAIRLVHEAASAGASLIVFPETYLPGYPFHIWLEPYGAWLRRTETYYANCPTSDGPECKTLEALAKSLDITIDRNGLFRKRPRHAVHVAVDHCARRLDCTCTETKKWNELYLAKATDPISGYTTRVLDVSGRLTAGNTTYH